MSKSDSEQPQASPKNIGKPSSTDPKPSAKLTKSQPSILTSASPPVIRHRAKKKENEQICKRKEVEDKTNPASRIPRSVKNNNKTETKADKRDLQNGPNANANHHHHRSTVCLSSSALPSLVMSRQSIVIVPGGGADEDEGIPAEEQNKGSEGNRKDTEWILSNYAHSV